MREFAILIIMILSVGYPYTHATELKDSDDAVIATVLGKEITVKDKDRLDGLILGVLLEQFAEDNKIEPTEAENSVFILKTDEAERRHQIELEENRKKLIAELNDSTLSAQERMDKETRLQTIEGIRQSNREMRAQTKGMEKERQAMKHRIARHYVRQWKINKALYARYGGRVIFQQAGVEPLDAYREFLKEHENMGSFQILDKQYESSFWRYFTNDAMHTFYPNDDGRKLINSPWWLMDQPPEQ